MHGRLGLMLMFLSIILMKVSRHKIRKMYFVGIPMGVLLVLCSGSRSMFLSLSLAILLLFMLGLSKRFRHDEPFVFVTRIIGFVAIILTIFFITYNIATSSHRGRYESIYSFWTRTITWSRGIELGLRFLPLGSGGGLPPFYNAAKEMEFEFPYRLTEFCGDPKGAQSYKIKWYSVVLKSVTHSLHSVHIEIFAGFGVIGILIVFYLFYIPIKYIWFAGFKLKMTKWAREVEICMYIAMMLLSLQLSIATESCNEIMWLSGLFYLFLIRSYKCTKRKLSFVG
ncbi:MAG: O-antigen ligase family protein [Deltaproteobacteria bacterium]|nr:O-antigen ligase family protein [Deltaproteobacteria bacterium]